MTEEEAVKKCEGLRGELEVPGSFKLQSADERFIEYTEDILEKGPVQETRAWCVQFGEASSWIEISLDSESGDVVRVLRSR